MTTSTWSEAGLVPVDPDERGKPEIAALPAGRQPDVATLFTFMRDAELRFGTLRMRVEERTMTARGEHVVASDLLLRHPGAARVITTQPGGGTTGSYELWLSDGDMVRTFSAAHRLGTRRPVRHVIRGLAGPDAADFPGSARVYSPLTPLPMETLPDTFVHPGGYCQNVLSTGDCWISGMTTVAGRPAIVLECAHPRTTEVHADRPDFHIEVAVDRADGVILRLIESIGRDVTRHAEVTEYSPNAPLPATAFDFEFPADTSMLF